MCRRDQPLWTPLVLLSGLQRVLDRWQSISIAVRILPEQLALAVMAWLHQRTPVCSCGELLAALAPHRPPRQHM